MNVRILWVRAMKCMCAQTRPRFILSSERVFGGMEFEPMLTPREKSPLPENVPRGGSNPRRCGQWAQALPAELFRPPTLIWSHRCARKLRLLHQLFYKAFGRFEWNLVFCSDFLMWWTSYSFCLVHSIFKGENPSYIISLKIIVASFRHFQIDFFHTF